MGRKKAIAPDFQTFWNDYGLKRERKAAEDMWNRLTVKEQRAACAGISAYRDDCRRRGIAMMYAQGYLHQRRWEQSAPVVDMEVW